MHSPEQDIAGNGSRPTPLKWFRFALTVIVLYAVWLLLSGRFQAQYMIIGAIGVVAVAAGAFPWSGSRAFPVLRFLAFVPWLLWQIVISNLRVAKAALSPRSAIQPQFVRAAPGMGRADDDERALAVLGCAITLTPGTLTVDISPDSMLIHALDADSAEDIRRGTMARRVEGMFR